MAISCGSAAFPSPGDRISFLGAVLLIAILALVVLILDPSDRETLLRVAVTLLAPAAISALAQLLLLRR